MSILFDDASSEDYYYTAGTLISNIHCSICALFISDSSVWPQFIVQIRKDANNYVAIVRDKTISSDYAIAVSSAGSVVVNTGVSPPSSGWVGLCATFREIRGNTNVAIYHYSHDGWATATGQLTGSVPDLTGSGIYIGSDGSAGNYFSGRICEVGAWDVLLLSAEARSIVEGKYSPRFIRQKRLKVYQPMIRDDRNNLMDGVQFSQNGTPVPSVHSAVRNPSRMSMYYKRVPKGLPDSVGRPYERKLIEQVF